MRRQIHILCLLSLFLSSFAARAARAEEAPDLSDRAQREALMKTMDAQTKSMNKETEKLAGSPQNTDAVYGLASEVLEDLIAETNGDPAKLMQLMELAKKDPAAFAAKLSPEKQKKLRELTRKIAPAGNVVAPTGK